MHKSRLHLLVSAALLLSIAFGLGGTSSVRAVDVSEFRDVTPADPVWEAFVHYTERNMFGGMADPSGQGRLVAADDVILKLHAALFLAKVKGVASPKPEDIVRLGILSTPPDSQELLNHATWIKMLSNAFNVPVGDPAKQGSWFVAPYIVGQTIGAVQDEKPFDFASRRFMLTTAYKYEKVFGTKTADELMAMQENRLMGVRDKLLDPAANMYETENEIWKNIIASQDIPNSGRLESIQNFNYACLIMVTMRQDKSNPGQQIKRKDQVKFFLDKAETSLPATKPFADDLRRIADGLSVAQ